MSSRENSKQYWEFSLPALECVSQKEAGQPSHCWHCCQSPSSGSTKGLLLCWIWSWRVRLCWIWSWSWDVWQDYPWGSIWRKKTRLELWKQPANFKPKRKRTERKWTHSSSRRDEIDRNKKDPCKGQSSFEVSVVHSGLCFLLGRH